MIPTLGRAVTRSRHVQAKPVVKFLKKASPLAKGIQFIKPAYI